MAVTPAATPNSVTIVTPSSQPPGAVPVSGTVNPSNTAVQAAAIIAGATGPYQTMVVSGTAWSGTVPFNISGNITGVSVVVQQTAMPSVTATSGQFDILQESTTTSEWQAVPAPEGNYLLTFNYNDASVGPPGTVWVMVHDNPVMAWLVDIAGDAVPIPQVLPGLPPPPPNTGSIVSPNWAHYLDGWVIAPNLLRGRLPDLLTFITTNNGATRKIYGNFVHPRLAIDYAAWAANNPGLILSGPPVPPSVLAAPAPPAEEPPLLLPSRHARHRAHTEA
jgi:hypothetical protein